MTPGELPGSLLRRLEAIRTSGQFRELRFPGSGIDMVSNDYLGLAGVPFQGNAVCLAGSTGSRLLSGNHPEHATLERECAKWLRSESSLYFPSGYTANIGLLSAIGQRHDTFYLDEEVHASVKDGVRLSQARHLTFRHNDPISLARKLELPCTGNRYVVVESLYSMSGDLAPLREIAGVCKDHGAFLIVDEAHSTGIFGPEGSGLTTALGLDNHVFARIHCFGKALGRSGAVVAGSASLIALLVNTSRPFIYTTAPPPVLAVDLIAQIQRIKAGDALREQLRGNTRLVRNTLHHPDTGSPILFVRTGSAESARSMSARLQEAGFDIRAILSPTVPEGREGVRIIVHANHRTGQLTDLCRILSGLSNEAI